MAFFANLFASKDQTQKYILSLDETINSFNGIESKKLNYKKDHLNKCIEKISTAIISGAVY